MEWTAHVWELPDPVLAMATHAAQSDDPVLVIGETGVGHETVARYIHAHSHRASGDFVDVNCGGLPDAILEAELVGSQGKRKPDPRRGAIEQAAGGVLFLFEPYPIRTRAEAVLLRLLREGMFQPLGGAATSADVRLIAASNEEMDGPRSRGEISTELADELSGIEIRIPPLRERREDILLLAERHIAENCRTFRRGNKTLTPSAKDALLRHEWPGNLREFGNVLARAVMLCDSEEITEDDFPERLAPRNSAARGGRG